MNRELEDHLESIGSFLQENRSITANTCILLNSFFYYHVLARGECRIRLATWPKRVLIVLFKISECLHGYVWSQGGYVCVPDQMWIEISANFKLNRSVSLNTQTALLNWITEPIQRDCFSFMMHNFFSNKNLKFYFDVSWFLASEQMNLVLFQCSYSCDGTTYWTEFPRM
jgi:hypothetical protein